MADLCQNLRLPRHARQTQNLANHSQNPKPTKLLHLASDSYRGGAESVFRNTIEQTLTLQNYEVFVASCDTPKSLPKGIDSKHFLALDDWASYPKPIGALKYVFNLKNYRILKTFLFTIRPDIIHTQNYLSRLSPSVLFALRSYKRKFPHTKLIFTQHNFGVCPNGGLYNYAQKSICEACIGRSKFRIMWKNCDRRGRIYSLLKGVRTLFYCGIFMHEDKLFDKILCVGEFQCQKHKDDGFDPKKLEVLQNPIQMQFYNSDVRLKDKQNLIVFFGRLAPEKNVPLLIEAFARLIKKPEFASYQLCIIGDGEDRARCENLARSLLAPKIPPNPHQTRSQDSQSAITHYTFLGRQSPTQIAQILKTAKISVVPSLWYETFGLVIVESILAGALPLVSRIGALKETIEEFCGCSFAFEIDVSKPYGERFLANVENLEIVLSSSLRSYEEIWQEFITKREEIVQNLDNPKYLRDLMKIYDLGGGGIILIDILLILACLHARYPIVFLDSQSPANLARILRYAKLAVMPTKCYETFGLSIAESTLSGAIPLASGIGAYGDTAREFCGFSFELYAEEGAHLVAKMSEILGSYPIVWREFESKRALLVQGLSHQQYLKNLLSLYQS